MKKASQTAGAQKIAGAMHLAKKGYYVMSDEWFDEYMYQIVVNKKYLPDSYIAEYDSEPIMLEPWDPMGSLAL